MLLVPLLALVLSQAPVEAPAAGHSTAALALLEGGSIEMSIEPEHLVLGRDTRAAVELVVRNLAGEPVDPEDLTVVSNVGRVEKPEHVAPGHFRAAYRPPSASYPHVALVLARGRTRDGLVGGVAILPMWGQGQLRVETKPDAVVTLRIGDESFGPVTADLYGTALIDVVAPPGPTLGVAESVDAAGNETKQTVDLGVPPFNRIALFPLESASAGETARLLLLAVDGRGSPLSDGAFVLAAEPGSVVETPRPLRAGIWLVEAKAPELVGSGRMVVRASLTGQRASTAEALVTVVEGPPARADVRITPTHHRAGDGRPIEVSARVEDAHGNITTTDGVDLVVSAGGLSDVRRERGGLIKARWLPPDTFDGAGESRLDVTGPAGVPIGSATLRLSVGPATRLEASPLEPLAGNTLGTWRVVVRATDEHGNPVPNVALSFQSPDGATLLSRDRTDDGATRFTFAAPSAPTTGRAEVRIRSDAGALYSGDVPLVLRRVALLVVTPRPQLHWNFGRLLLAGAGMDTTLAVPLPLPPGPISLSAIGTASTGVSLALPVSLSLSQPLNLRRMLMTVPAALLVGAELRWKRLILQASAGGGVSFAQARIATASQSPLALLGLPVIPPLPSWGQTARLYGVGPMLSARLASGVRFGPGAIITDVRLDVPVYLGTALNGFAGGLVWGLGYGLML